MCLYDVEIVERYRRVEDAGSRAVTHAAKEASLRSDSANEHGAFSRNKRTPSSVQTHQFGAGLGG